MSDKIEITVRIGMSDYDLFTSVINQGIDSHLEAFTKSDFTEKSTNRGDRLVMNFDRSELPLLVRRLNEVDTDESIQWADDIEALDEYPKGK